MPILYIVLGALAALLGMLLYAQIPQPIELSFLGYTWQAPLSLVLGSCLVIGLLVGYLLGVPGRVYAAWLAHRQTGEIRSRDRTIATQQRRIADLERDLAVARQPAPVTIEEPREPAAGVDTGVRRVA